MAIRHGEKIPADVGASVKELTAAAEQYMDLVPSGTDTPGQYLRPGATITNAVIPISVGTLLNTVNSLVNSLNAEDLNTLSAALATGLQDAGGDLHSIIVDGNMLVSALQSAIPGTQELINAGNQVLTTFDATSNDFSRFSANLNTLSAQLKTSNQALIATLQNGAAAGSALDSFLSRYGSSTVGLIDNLSGSTDVAYQRQDAVRALFEVLPLFATDVSETVSGGQVHFQLDFNTVDPVCPYTPMLPPPTAATSATANLSGTCPTVAPNLLQRGAATAPQPHS
jgi:phospholipid/cholesterol/gamma-HCH transport system substrate-binding protein